MRNGYQRFILFASLVLSAMAPVVSAAAQGTFESIDAKARLRSPVVDAQGALMYVAAYDHNEVWQIDLATRGMLRSAPVGRGPVALALSRDGQTLACANRLSGDVTLLQLPALTLLATIPCDKGTSAVAALPDGRFVAANTFADSLTVVSFDDLMLPHRVAAESVPNGIAAGDTLVAVSTRVPPALRMYSVVMNEASTTLSLPSPPLSVVHLNGSRFAVATETEVLVADGATAAIVQRSGLQTKALNVFDKRILALTDDALIVLNDSLIEEDRLAILASGSGVAGAPGAYIVLTPVRKTWEINQYGAPVAASAPPTVTASPIPAIQPAETQSSPDVIAETPRLESTPLPEARDSGPVPAEPAAELAVVEAEEAIGTVEIPAPGESAQTEAPLPAPAVEEPTETAAEPQSEPAPAEMMVESPGAEATPDSAAESAPPSQARMVRPKPTGFGETRAPVPKASMPPGPVPTGGPGKKSIEQAFKEGLDLGSKEGGFHLPAQAEFMENLKFDYLELTEGGTQYHATGNVSLQLEDTYLSADEILLNPEKGELEAIGNVDIQQPTSSVQAARIKYIFPIENNLEAEEGAPVEVDATDASDAEVAARIENLGFVDAQELHLKEPTREIWVDRLAYDMANRAGIAEEARGNAGIFYFGAQKVRLLGPASSDGEELWITTCDKDPPHYRIRIQKAALRQNETISGESARLQVGKLKTPVYWPKWRMRAGKGLGFEFDSGHSAEIGYYVNYAQRFALTPNIETGLRLYPTSREGIGVGVEAAYDYMETPASPLFRGQGEFRTLYTTKERGYTEFYHRHELLENTILLTQWEQWYDRDFVKDFYYDEYRNRSEPRTFANVTHTGDTYIATGTVRQTTNDWVSETERAPEVTYHLLERQLASSFYVSFDTVNGYNEREPDGIHAVRSVNIGRLTFDWDINEALTIAPFWEADVSWYSDEPRNDDSNLRFANTMGLTLQSRFHKAYPGAFGFSGFKHVVVPSVTYSYRPEPTMGVEETPRFDAYDNVYGRSRVESKVANVVYGRDAETQEVWQVARLSLYQGNDFWNEIRKTEDYEIEMDLRPRPWWGWQVAAERHRTSNDFDLDDPYPLQTTLLAGYERLFERPFNPARQFQYNAIYGDYDRLLTYLYYDDQPIDGRFNGRIGFAYTETQEQVFNREVLYGLGYQLGEKWSVAFEHRYDFERDNLYRQTYEVRRNLHCWDAALQFRERESGWDIGFEMSLTAFPGTKIKF